MKEFIISGKNIKHFIFDKDLESFLTIKQNYLGIESHKQNYLSDTTLTTHFLTEKPIWNEPKYNEIETYLLNLNLEPKYIESKITHLKELYQKHMQNN